MLKLTVGIAFLLLVALGLVFYSLKNTKSARFICTLIFVFSACAMYFKWGAYSEIKALIVKEKQQKEVALALKQYKGPDEIIKKMERHLLQKPDSPKGWFLLGKLYAAQNKFAKANIALSKAYALDNKSLEIKLSYMESNYFINNKQMKGLINFAAMDAFDHQEYAKASFYWQKIGLLLPDGSKEKRAILSAIASAQTKMHAKKILTKGESK